MADYFLHAGCTNTSGKDSSGYWSNREFPTCSGCDKPFRLSRTVRNYKPDPNASPPPARSTGAPQVAKQDGNAGPSELAVKVAVLLGHVGGLPNATLVAPSEDAPPLSSKPGTTPQNISTEPSGIQVADGEETEGMDVDEALGEQIATVCEEIETTFEDIEVAIAKLESAEGDTADFSKQLQALKAEMKAAEESQTTDYRAALESFQPISQQALLARAAVDQAATSALSEKQRKEEKAAREALGKKVETTIDQIFNEMLVAQDYSLDTGDIDRRRPAMRSARFDAMSEASKMTHGERIASLERTLKDAEAAVAELRRQVEEAKAAEAEREALSEKVKTAINQISGEIAVASVSLNIQSFNEKRASLRAAQLAAMNPSNPMTHEERVASLEGTRKKAEEAAADLKRQVEEAKAAKAEREALSGEVETSIDQIHGEIVAAIGLPLNTESFSDMRGSLEAAKSSALDLSNGVTHQDRMASLNDTRKKAQEAVAELKGLIAAAKPAQAAVKALDSLIEQFEGQYPGGWIGRFIEKHTDLEARQGALKKESVPKDALARLDKIAEEANNALVEAQAALKKQPAAAEIRARVAAPLKTARSDLATLKGAGVDTKDIEILVEDIEDDLTEASELTDQNAAIAAAEKIVAKVGEVQKKLDAEKSKDEVAKSVEKKTWQIVDVLQYSVKKLTKLHLAGSTIGKIANDLEDELDDVASLTDTKARFAALARIKRAADEALDRAEELVSAAEGPTGDATTAPETPEVYKKALEKLYGLKIEIPKGFTNTHLDKVFDMFAMLPMDFVAHGRLQRLKYDPAGEKKSGAYEGASALVTMNDFPDPEVEDSFTVDGKVIKVNSFNVTTLHEIGHSVDALHGIMAAAMKGGGNGGWKTHGVDEIVPIFVGELRKAGGMAKQPEDAVLSQAVGAALKTGKVDKPRELDDPDWMIMRKFLEERCLTIRADQKPWNADPGNLKVDDRVYQESYPNQWVSYEMGQRVSTLVSKYQWRAPGEWFSELFAISWLKKAKPPSGVGGAIAKYLWPPEGTA